MISLLVARLSKPLQLALLATAVLTAVALLKPDTVDVLADDASDALAARSPQNMTGEQTNPTTSDAPWIRAPGEEWKPSDAEQRRAAEIAAAATAPVAPPAPSLPPPMPVAPDPALVYLGRMDQDGRSYVFLGRGKDPQVVEIGGQVDPQWKVEKATAGEVELRYLPLNEIRAIPVMGAQ